MILTGTSIKRNVELNRIKIDPFSEEKINPNYYNFRLGHKILIYQNLQLDSKLINPTLELSIPDDAMILAPDRIYLGHSVEKIGSDYLRFHFLR